MSKRIRTYQTETEFLAEREHNQAGCDGEGEYLGCEWVSNDWLRLRAMEKRLQALADEWGDADRRLRSALVDPVES